MKTKTISRAALLDIFETTSIFIHVGTSQLAEDWWPVYEPADLWHGAKFATLGHSSILTITD